MVARGRALTLWDLFLWVLHEVLPQLIRGADRTLQQGPRRQLDLDTRSTCPPRHY